MLILSDTNLLLRLVEPEHAQRPIAAEAIDVVRKLVYRLVIVPQVVYEFWAVGTRPAEVNGLGLSSAEVSGKFDGLMPSFKLLLDERSIFEIGSGWFWIMTCTASKSTTPGSWQPCCGTKSRIC